MGKWAHNRTYTLCDWRGMIANLAIEEQGFDYQLALLDVLINKLGGFRRLSVELFNEFILGIKK
ncbi:MAG: hypothetical protein MUP81_03335 [Dehalococcoidia bacterium]|nr:hypothetical protein [Dehalococcoidia bacterium]